MKQMKSQVEFLQQLYLLKGTVDSVAERAEFWREDDMVPIPFGYRLNRSPLVQKTVRELIYRLWDSALTLRDYVGEDQRPPFRLLEELGQESLNKLPASDNLDPCASNFQPLGLSPTTFQITLFGTSDCSRGRLKRSYTGSEKSLTILEKRWPQMIAGSQRKQH